MKTKNFLTFLTMVFLIGWLTAISAAAQSFVSFAARREFATQGRQPGSVAAGDFNHDGRMDLVVAHSRASSTSGAGLSILSGAGDGSFSVTGFLSGSDPIGVAVGDLNGDGKQDLASANFFGGSASVRLGNGDGSFQSPFVIASGSLSHDVIIRDFNGDGRQDLAVLNVGDPPRFDVNNSVSILFGNGDGSLQAAMRYGVGPQPLDFTAADFNGDGKIDLAVKFSGEADPIGGVSLLINNGNGTFPSAVTLRPVASPSAILAGDFNNDGKADLALTNRTGNVGYVSILIGNGNATFAPPVAYAIGIFSLSLMQGDFNNDGKIDLVAANKGSFDVSVLHSNGDGTFQPATSYFAGRDPVGVVAADFNGDGQTDLATANEAVDSVSILLNKGGGAFNAESNFSAGGIGGGKSVVADFNRDCRADVALTHRESNNISVLLAGGNAGFQTPRVFAVGSAPNSISTGDFNTDGKIDLAVSNPGVNAQDPGSVSILIGNGDGTFQTAINVLTDNGPRGIAVGDFNGDGKPDFAAPNFRSNTVSIKLGNGDGTFQNASPLVFPSLSGVGSVAAGDFNRDGKADLVVSNEFQGLIVVFTGVGDGTFLRGAELSFGLSQSIGDIKITDFNRDGKLDLITTSRLVLRGGGDGTFQRLPDVDLTGSTDVVIADLNGDNIVDLAFANAFASRIEVAVGNGDGTFQPAFRFGSGGLPTSIGAGDFNSDGRADLITTNTGSFGATDRISLLFNKKLLWKGRRMFCRTP